MTLNYRYKGLANAIGRNGDCSTDIVDLEVLG